jgi:hypothetical protein
MNINSNLAMQNAPVNSNPVGNWVQSINQWMPGYEAEDQMLDGEDGEQGESPGDIIARARGKRHVREYRYTLKLTRTL